MAAEAKRAASKAGTNVLLIDTAGRMQDNAPLMREISNLVNRNAPDLVLFVGEALVGHDGVDQLVTFNNRLREGVNNHNHHNHNNHKNKNNVGETGRSIDGILLTKFDTVDANVGTYIYT